jgi:hypothetical protein
MPPIRMPVWVVLSAVAGIYGLAMLGYALRDLV